MLFDIKKNFEKVFISLKLNTLLIATNKVFVALLFFCYRFICCSCLLEGQKSKSSIHNVADDPSSVEFYKQDTNLIPIIKQVIVEHYNSILIGIIAGALVVSVVHYFNIQLIPHIYSRDFTHALLDHISLDDHVIAYISYYCPMIMALPAKEKAELILQIRNLLPSLLYEVLMYGFSVKEYELKHGKSD